MSLANGTRLGSYEIVGALGVGGMGEVYRARDTKLNRDVAIKVLLPAVADDPDRLARFRREAQVLASLNHPHIGHIYGIEDSGGSPALVMELVDGPTLADRIARGALPLAEALPIAKQIAEALEAAHDQSIVHRDLKPANIKLTPDDKVKVLDFGLAKAMEANTSVGEAGPSSLPTMTTPAMTGLGVILGTAAYMSPEQARGKVVDRRADIWAFGCVLFEMLAGHRCFDGGDSVSDAIAAILKTDPDWSSLPADTPPHIRTLLRRCLEKDVPKRLPHIGVARLEIDEGETGSPAQTQTALLNNRRLWKPAVAVFLALVAGAVSTAIVWRLKPAAPAPSITRFSLPLATGEQLNSPASGQSLAFSPDGTQLVYAAGRQLYLRKLHETDAHVILGSEMVNARLSPVFSPDGQWIAFYAGTDWAWMKIPVSGGAPVKICDMSWKNGGPDGASWDNDGFLFAQRDAGIMRVTATGGEPHVIVPTKPPARAQRPQLLPDGRTILFTLSTIPVPDRWDHAEIVLYSLSTGTLTTILKDGSDARYLATGHIAFVRAGAVFVVPFDLQRLEVTGEAVQLLEGVKRSESEGLGDFAVSNSGSLAYFPGPVTGAVRQTLAFVNRKGQTEPLKLANAAFSTPRISLDGRRLAYGIDDGKKASVWVYELSGESQPQRLTNESNKRFPVWSADGNLLAFQSDQEGNLDIFTQRWDNTGQPQRLTHAGPGESHTPESWSPMNEALLYTVAKGSTVALWMHRFSDGQDVPFAGIATVHQQGGPAEFSMHAAFSPDGNWVAYRVAGNEVDIHRFPTGENHRVGRGRHPVWSRDGKELVWLSGPVQWWVEPIVTAPTFKVGDEVRTYGLQGRVHDSVVRNYDTAADGRLISVVPSERIPGAEPATSEIQIVLNWLEEVKQHFPTKHP